MADMKMKKKNKVGRRLSRINWKVILYSFLALICLALVYTVDWIFIVPVLILIWLNHRELFPKKK